MMKKIILLVFVLFYLGGIAQNKSQEADDYGMSIGDNGILPVPDPNAMLDLSNVSNKGILFPMVNLKHPAQSHPMKLDPAKVAVKPDFYDGIMLYNTFDSKGSITDDIQLTRGHYVWKEGRWNPLKNEGVVRSFVSHGIDVSVLGYYPWGSMSTAPKIVDGSVTVDSNVYPYRATQVKCKAFTKAEYPLYGDNHGYCAYRIDFPTTTNSAITGLNWIEAFNLAEKMKGYLPVITTTESANGAQDGEWAFIKKEFLSEGATDPYQQANIWIGYNKVQYPGTYQRGTYSTPFPEYTWITGEKSVVNWETASDIGYGGLAKIQAYFAANEPNNDRGVEGCTHIWEYFKGFINGIGNVDTTPRTWNDSACNIRRTRAGVGPSGGNNFNYLLVEFQN